MGILGESDIAAMLADLDAADGAVDAVIGGHLVTALFDDAYAEDDDIEGHDPQLTCGSADLPAGLDHGAEVSFDGRAFTIRNIRPDGAGVTVLVLQEAST